MSKMLLKTQKISKSFSGVKVLDSVSFELRAGEVHVLAGENGAGKSTLIKIISGVYADYGGEVFFNGEEARFSNPLQANAAGISVIHQEMSLIDSMSVLDNIFLGREMQTFAGLGVDRRTQLKKAQELCHDLDLRVDLDSVVEEHSVSTKNQIEIAKALAFNCRVLIMDEPTSALNGPEVEKLFQLIEKLKKLGCGIIYISHKMEEIYRIADRITVLRDGASVITSPAKELPERELIKHMIGRELTSQFPERKARFGDVKFKVQAEGVSLSVRAGEILGVAGLQGSGNSELFSNIFEGKIPDIQINGESIRVRDPRSAIKNSMALLTSDRKTTGLVLSMDIIENTTLASLSSFSTFGFLQNSKRKAAAARQVEQLKIRAHGLGQEVQTLSGGNQQKVAIAKCLETNPQVLLLNEPTRGVDVGAKHEIYELINQWTQAGMAILLITSELPELLALSDRIIVMHRGKISAEYDRTQATPESIISAAMGVSKNGVPNA